LSDRTPIHIRRNIESYDDPYIEQESPAEHTPCKRCGSIYTAGRWYLKDQVPAGRTARKLGGDFRIPTRPTPTTCPACRKQADKVPGGVLKLTGRFINDHKVEIINLIHNQSGKAQAVNPLERIMDMQSNGSEITITTTNEKLAQRIGRALHKAYSGTIEYQFSEDTKLARVNWRREE